MFVGMPMCEGRRKNSECCSSNLSSCPPLPPATRVSVCVCVCIYVYRGHRRMPGVLFCPSLPCSLQTDNSLRVWSVASKPSNPTIFLSAQLWAYRHVHANVLTFFHGFWGSECRSSHCAASALYPPSHPLPHSTLYLERVFIALELTK